MTAILDRRVSSHTLPGRAGGHNPLSRTVAEPPLDAARVRQGRQHSRQEVLNLADVVARVISRSYPTVRSRRHRLTVRMPQRFVWLEGDPVRLEQMLVSLLTNVVRSTEPGGTIRLSLAQENEEAVLQVRADSTGRGAEFAVRLPALPKAPAPGSDETADREV
jgi:K+-sensing histidine kinase KdpD